MLMRLLNIQLQPANSEYGCKCGGVDGGPRTVNRFQKQRRALAKTLINQIYIFTHECFWFHQIKSKKERKEKKRSEHSFCICLTWWNHLLKGSAKKKSVSQLQKKKNNDKAPPPGYDNLSLQIFLPCNRVKTIQCCCDRQILINLVEETAGAIRLNNPQI